MRYKVLAVLIVCFIFVEGVESVFALEADKRMFPTPAIPFHPEKYICYRSEYPLVIDGKMDPVWEKAAWTRDFSDIEGDAKPAPRFRTRARMLWDDRFFYIFAELEEPDVWAKLMQRDTVIYYDNDFEVFIDPNGDTHQYYELEINAFNTVWDLFLDKPYRDRGTPLFFWDIGGLETAVHVSGSINAPGDRDKGWQVEIAIPWPPLKECAGKEAPPQNGDQWRVNFSRVEWRVKVEDGRYVKVINPETGKPYAEDNWVWSPQGLVNMHYPEMWGFVQFSDRVVGEGVDHFIENSEEKVKWALRTIYYHQKEHFERSGRYTDRIDDLNMETMELQDYRWPPYIRTTMSLFEASLSSLKGGTVWRISQDGRIWRTQND